MTLKWLGAVPWLAFAVGAPFLNHVEPFILGLPLQLAWAVGCALLSSLVLAVIYLVDPVNRRPDDRP